MGNASYSFFSERRKKNHYNAHGKFGICIENEKIKKPRTSDQSKIINSRSDILENANFDPIFQI
jgi:hypothetical protein